MSSGIFRGIVLSFAPSARYASMASFSLSLSASVRAKLLAALPWIVPSTDSKLFTASRGPS